MAVAQRVERCIRLQEATVGQTHGRCEYTSMLDAEAAVAAVVAVEEHPHEHLE